MPGMIAAATAGGYQERISQLSNPEVLLDWGDASCYSGSGTTFSNLGSGGSTYDGDLVNGAAYSSSFGGIITCDGTDDMISIDNNFTQPRAGGTCMIWLRTHQAESRPFTSFTAGAFQGFVNFGGTDGVDRAETITNCNNWFAVNGANTFGTYTNVWTCVIGRTASNLVTWFERGINQDTGSYGNIDCSSGAASQMENDFNFRHFGENTTYDSHWDGDYGVIALWDTNLTDHQCLQAFGVYRHRYGV